MDKSKQLKERFDVIKMKVQNSKNNNLQATRKWSKVIIIIESDKLLYEIENSQIIYEEALKRIEDIRSDINRIVSVQSINSNQANVLNILFILDEILLEKVRVLKLMKKAILRFLKKNQTKKKRM